MIWWRFGKICNRLEVKVALDKLGEVLLLHLDKNIVLSGENGSADLTKLLRADRVGLWPLNEGLDGTEVLLVAVEGVGAR